MSRPGLRSSGVCGMVWQVALEASLCVGTMWQFVVRGTWFSIMSLFLRVVSRLAPRSHI